MGELDKVILDSVDQKAAESFPGLVVRKDLLRRVRSAYGVPMFVIEFLLGKYCASTDPEVIEEGIRVIIAGECRFALASSPSVGCAGVPLRTSCTADNM